MARLGCGAWRAVVQCRGGFTPLGELPWSALEMSRRLDDTSGASVTVTSAMLSALAPAARETCLSILAEATPWEHELALWRGDTDEPDWVGPLTEPEFGVGSVTLPARDLTAWWERRKLGRNRTFVATDLATIFEQYHVDAMHSDPTPNIVLAVTPCGVLGDRAVLASDGRRAADDMRELSRSGVDYTAVGRTVICGGKETPVAALGTLITEHFDQPALKVSGLSAATEITVLGGRTAQGGAVTGIAGGGDDRLGLLQSVFTEPDIGDRSSAAAAAATRLDLLEAGPDYVTGMLIESAPVEFSALLPGALATLKIGVMGRATDGVYRLLGLDVRASVDNDGVQTEQVGVTFTSPGTFAA